MDRHIFWIASYPKSGNTLIRAIISSLFFSENGLFEFKMLNNIPIIEDTINLKFVKNKNPEEYKELNNIEILSKYWLELQSKTNLNFFGDFMFVKTHHALIKMLNNPFTIENNTRGIIYVVRDPRDIVLSVSNYFGFNIKKSIETLQDENFFLRWNDTNNLFLNKKKPLSYISSWKNHYLSWNTNSFNCPKLIIKYEDMVYNKSIIINKLLSFFIEAYGFKFSNLEEKIPNIIKHTDFKYLKKMEDEEGFQESKNTKFFNVGKKNQWEEKLSRNQVYEIEKVFYEILKKFNYPIMYYKQSN
ncbi:sulfotransferase domain-containing protein [bacterium]|nr:sulfotransferase domain-containing protein [bacterium]